ncbi:MAG: glycosyltransferase family 9 protein [Elusimicrobiota bacterium]|jgi:ADP-heptose:LPS heptosyltransferase
MEPSPAPGRILVLMLRRIGDVLLTTPAVRALRRAFPEARIDFAVEAPADQVLRGNPDLSAVLVCERSPLGLLRAAARVRAARYDWTVDFMGTPRSAMLSFASGAALRAGPAQVSHRWAYNRRLTQSSEACYSALEKVRVLRQLGLSPDETDLLPRLSPPPASRLWAQELLRSLFPGAGPVVALVPGSRKPTRRWPARHYAELGRLLRERCGARVLVCWGPGERDLAEEVAAGIGPDAALHPPVSDLLDLAAILSLCRAVVTNCSGPRHIATACGTPTLTVHASSDPACWNPPDRSRFPVVRRSELGCIGCRLNDCPKALECLEALAPARVFEAAEKLMSLEAKCG